MFFNINAAILAGLLSLTSALGFENLSVGSLRKGNVPMGQITASAGVAEVILGKARTGKKALRLLAGEEQSLTYNFAKAIVEDAEFEFWMERWTGASAYKVTVNARDKQGKLTLLDTVTKQSTGSYMLRSINIPKGTRAIVITSTGGGVLLDDFMLHIGPMLVKNVTIENPGVQPIMKRALINPAVRINFSSKGKDGSGISAMRFKLSPAKSVESVTLRVSDAPARMFKTDGDIFTARPNEKGIIIVRGRDMRGMPSGESTLWLDVKPSKSAKVGSKITISEIDIRAGKKSYKQKEPITQPVGHMVAKGGQSIKLPNGTRRNSLQFRIPGIITSHKTGALIASLDARWNGSADLCADIDVLSSRSTDGGQTWSPLQISMDIGPGAANGVGDSCILQDDTGRIWVHGLGAHFSGGACLFKSSTGNNPRTTGQWYMTYSDDDGKTWAKDLVNPTKQIKKDKWNCILSGPGTGITTSKGVIIFPAQIWQTGHKYRARATICYSKDNGKTWVYGEGIPHLSSECVAVELEDGSIMLNARDERKGGKRVVYVTRDLAKTWLAHSSNLKALQEPTCQASLIKIDSKKYGKILLFSNPKYDKLRYNMTIRYSKDEGKTWSNGYLYSSRICAGYSSLTMIDEDTIGVLYESPIHNLEGPPASCINFQRILLKDIMDAK